MFREYSVWFMSYTEREEEEERKSERLKVWIFEFWVWIVGEVCHVI